MAKAVSKGSEAVGLVLLFNSCGPVHLMAQLHAPGCAALNRAGRKVARLEGEDLPGDVDDLIERGYPVRLCKCTGAVAK